MDSTSELIVAEAEPIDPESLTHEVTIFPQDVDGQIGIYRDEQLTLKKEMAALGIDAEYLHDADHRQWLGLKGEVVITILLGLLTSGAVAGVQSWLTSKFGKAPVKLKLVRVWRSESSGESKSEWYEVEGSGSDVAQALEALRDDPGT